MAKYNPIHFAGNDGISSIDPDHYFDTYSNNSCNYYDESEFNSHINNIKQHNSLSMLHTNIRSLPKQHTYFLAYLSCLNILFSFIGLAETWTTSSNCNLYNIHGYNSESLYRSSRKGGGVTIFIQNSISYNLRDDLNLMSDSIECIFIEIDKTEFNSKHNIIIGEIYRPPNTDISKFNEHICYVMQTIGNENKIAFLMGDYNLNHLDINNSTPMKDFSDILNSNLFMPLITKPTRVHNNSHTLIDNIYCNSLHNNSPIVNGILMSDLSDHYSIFTIHNYQNNIPNNKLASKIRIYNKCNTGKFINLLRNHNWSDVLQCSDSKLVYPLFINYYQNIFYQAFPLTHKIIKYKNRKPWLSITLKQQIIHKNKFFKIFKKYPTFSNKNKYKSMRNNVNNKIKKAEKLHYEHLFSESRDNSKKTWSIIKDIIGSNSQSQPKANFLINNSIVTSEEDICSSFNTYFTNVGINLAKNIPLITANPTSYIKDSVSNTITYVSCNISEILNIINSLKNSGPGSDNIPSNVVKLSANYIAAPIAHIINICFNNGIFPDNLKVAKVKPIFKAGKKNIISNYRPISILPVISKIFERILYNRLILFINKHNILSDNQFGFRANRSTCMPISLLVNKISQELDNNNLCISIFIDLSKAFDTISHDILLKKLYTYGVRGTFHNIIKNYLSNRKQFVSFNNSSSNVLSISCGVPQGSILGPLLFLLYINDMTSVSKILFPLIFADDTTLTITGTHLDSTIITANHELNNISRWLYCNKLSLNIKKTNYIIFNGNKKITPHQLLHINNTPINRVYDTKFLGVIIDSKLTWGEHLHYIRNKVSRGIGIIHKTRPYLNNQTLVSLYYSFVYPYISYCIEVWGAAYDVKLLPIFKLQKKCIRTITYSEYNAHSLPLFKRLHIMPLQSLYYFKIQLYMYKIFRKEMPKVVQNIFIINSDIHDYNTRSSLNFNFPVIKSELAKRSIFNMGVKIYHYYSDKLDTMLPFHLYRKKLCNIIFENGYGTII